MAHTASKAPQQYVWRKSWGPRASGFHSNMTYFSSYLLAAQPPAVSPKARGRTSSLHTAPTLRWELGQAGGRRESKSPRCEGRGPGGRPREEGGMRWRQAVCTGALATAVASRVVSAKLSLVQSCIGRWVYLSSVMSKSLYFGSVLKIGREFTLKICWLPPPCLESAPSWSGLLFLCPGSSRHLMLQPSPSPRWWRWSLQVCKDSERRSFKPRRGCLCISTRNCFFSPFFLFSYEFAGVRGGIFFLQMFPSLCLYTVKYTSAAITVEHFQN